MGDYLGVCKAKEQGTGAEAPIVHFSSRSLSGPEGMTSVKLPVTLSKVFSHDITVGYSVNGGTATGNGTDFSLFRGTLTIPAGERTRNIPLTVVDDNLSESSETVSIHLGNPTNAKLNTDNVDMLYTILDNDPGLNNNVSFDSAVSNQSEGASFVQIPVNLSTPHSNEITVHYKVTGGTATNGTDFTMANGELVFPAGKTTENITLNIVNDAMSESNETIVISLHDGIHTNLGDTLVHTHTIVDND